jgi:hypothetical protein
MVQPPSSWGWALRVPWAIFAIHAVRLALANLAVEPPITLACFPLCLGHARRVNLAATSGLIVALVATRIAALVAGFVRLEYAILECHWHFPNVGRAEEGSARLLEGLDLVSGAATVYNPAARLAIDGGILFLNVEVEWFRHGDPPNAF